MMSVHPVVILLLQRGLNNATGYAGRHRARRHLAACWNERRGVLSQQRRPAMMRDGREGGRRHGNCRLHDCVPAKWYSVKQFMCVLRSVCPSVGRWVGRPHKYFFLSFFLFKIVRKFRPQEGKHGLQHSISTQSMRLSAYPAK